MKLKVKIFLSTILITLLLIPLYMIATPTHYKETVFTDYKTTTLTTQSNGSELYFIDPKIKNENIDDLTSITFKWNENKMICIRDSGSYGVDYNVYNGKIIYK